MNVYIHIPRFRDVLKKGARSLLLAYALLLVITLWNAEFAYSNQIAFQKHCESVNGIITLTDGVPTCTRLRSSGGMLQL